MKLEKARLIGHDGMWGSKEIQRLILLSLIDIVYQIPDQGNIVGKWSGEYPTQCIFYTMDTCGTGHEGPELIVGNIQRYGGKS